MTDTEILARMNDLTADASDWVWTCAHTLHKAGIATADCFIKALEAYATADDATDDPEAVGLMLAADPNLLDEPRRHGTTCLCDGPRYCPSDNSDADTLGEFDYLHRGTRHP